MYRTETDRTLGAALERTIDHSSPWPACADRSNRHLASTGSYQVRRPCDCLKARTGLSHPPSRATNFTVHSSYYCTGYFLRHSSIPTTVLYSTVSASLSHLLTVEVKLMNLTVERADSWQGLYVTPSRDRSWYCSFVYGRSRVPFSEANCSHVFSWFSSFRQWKCCGSSFKQTTTASFQNLPNLFFTTITLATEKVSLNDPRINKLVNICVTKPAPDTETYQNIKTLCLRSQSYQRPLPAVRFVFLHRVHKINSSEEVVCLSVRYLRKYWTNFY
jgi:hypothetical protein